jgi:hypothetical protein
MFGIPIKRKLLDLLLIYRVDMQDSKSNGKLHLTMKYHVGKISLYTVSLPDYEAYINSNDPQVIITFFFFTQL